MYAKDNPGLDVGDVETCIGRESKANTGSEKVFLFGNCSIEANKELKGAIIRLSSRRRRVPACVNECNAQEREGQKTADPENGQNGRL
jgi:hypothetical protein